MVFGKCDYGGTTTELCRSGGSDVEKCRSDGNYRGSSLKLCQSKGGGVGCGGSSSKLLDLEVVVMNPFQNFVDLEVESGLFIMYGLLDEGGGRW